MSALSLSPPAVDELLQRARLQTFDLALQQALVAELTGLPTPIGEPPLAGRLQPVLDTLQFTLLKIFLRLDEPRALALDEAFARGQALQLPEFNWEGSWFGFWRFLDECVGERFEDELEDWQSQTLRQSTATAADTLWGALLVPRMARIFAALRTSRAGLPSADTEQMEGALQLAAGNLGPHGELLARLVLNLSQHVQALADSASEPARP